MRSYLAGAPLWVALALQSVIFGVVWTAGTAAVQDHHLGTRLLIIGAVVAVLYGVSMSFPVRRQRQRVDRVTGVLTAAQRRAVTRAVATGTPPEDPVLRVAAVALARAALAAHTRTRTASIVMFAVVAVICAVAAIASWGYLIVTAVCIAAIVERLRYPAGLRKRIAALDLGGWHGPQSPA